MAGLIEFLQGIPSKIENIPYNPLAYGLINAGAQMQTAPRSRWGHGVQGFLEGLTQAQQNKQQQLQFQQQQQLAPLLQAVKIAELQRAMNPYGKSTPGVGFHPPGSELFQDKRNKVWYWKHPDGSISPDQGSMTQFQQTTTDPDFISNKARRMEGAKSKKIINSQGQEVFPSVEQLNPDYYGQPPSQPLQPPNLEGVSTEDLMKMTLGELMGGIRQKESSNNYNAVNPESGSFGAYQFMPSTAAQPGYGIKPLQDKSPAEQDRFATDLLLKRLQEFPGEPSKAIASWLMGINGVKKNGPGPAGSKYAQDIINLITNPKPPVKTFPAPSVKALPKPEIKPLNITPATAEDKAKFAEMNAGAAVTGKAKAEAAFDLNDTLTTVDYSIDLIDKIESHKGLDLSLGAASYLGLKNLRGSKEASFELIRKQLEGRAFLTAFESLRGGGHITEIEGEKATAAIARLKTTQSKEEFIQALGELKSILLKGRQNSIIKAGKDPKEFPFKSGTGQNLEFMGFE